ncbi:MAG: DUF2478 domain-containing protein [Hyphomicrobium sp.]|nr:DUF2478 domain-containing protein [Hyphomicrobium sp.]
MQVLSYHEHLRKLAAVIYRSGVDDVDGLLARFAVAGLPILTAVADKCYDDWIAFTGGYGTTLACERRVVDDWWCETSLREGRTRVLAP